MQNTVGQQYKQLQQQQCAPQVCAPQVSVQQGQTQPVQYQQNPSQQQNVQVPNYSGVNIQIFNPSVGVPGSTPVYNVNAPQYQAQGCYPADYYTKNWGAQTGAAGGAQTGAAGQTAGQTVNGSSNGINSENTQNTSSRTDSTTTVKNITEDKKKTEKRNIVQLTDEYIMNLENYLNSQDKEIRMMGAKEVAARLQEDDSRKDDKALTALVNKMLQDPYQPVRFLALSLLDSRIVTGDDYTKGVLQRMQNGESGYGQDALDASQILLKMSGQTVQKEFEVKTPPKKD